MNVHRTPIVFSSFLLSFALGSISANDGLCVSSERIAEAKVTLGKSLNATDGKKLASQLVSRGMAEVDAERIAKNAYEKYAVCIVDVLVDQAVKQDHPIKPILDSMANFAVSPELQEIGDSWDKEATRQALLPCATSVSDEVKDQLHK